MQKENFSVSFLIFLILSSLKIYNLDGKHMSYTTNQISAKNPFAKFVTVKQSCLHCKGAINQGALCKTCSPKIKEIFVERQLEVNYYERLYSDLWNQCQRCQGSFHQEVICDNYDCPIFFKRTKTRKELKELNEKLNRFNDNVDW